MDTSVIDEVMSQPLIMARLFEKPKCKPWDIVKGRRFKCCHGLMIHTRYCLDGVTEIIIPKIGILKEQLNET